MQTLTLTHLLLIMGSSILITIAVLAIVIVRDRPWRQ